jgi:acyl-homoserine lactone synthase
MIRIVTSQNKHKYFSALDQHYQIRHDIYVGERRWLELAKPDGREKDQFDTEDVVRSGYLDRFK